MISQEVFKNAAQTSSRETSKPVECTGYFSFGENLAAGRFKLANGLTILLLADRRAPIFAYQTWFKVGSKHENPHKTGLAHLFEHLMFKGTKKHPSGQFDREMERRGSQTNAATWVDWTYYIEALAARGDNLAMVIDFEVDRMTNLILDEKTFRSELEVVKNERRMSVDDNVRGAMTEALFEQAYTHHPYRWPTIGSMRHLEESTIADLQAFYHTYYAPNNATVVVAGDLDIAETLTRLAQNYGELTAQKIPEQQKIIEPAQTAPRSLYLKKSVVTPQIILGFHIPGQLHRDFAALEILNDILFSGDSARLYRKLVTETQLASEVGGYALPFAEPGLYEMMLTLRPGVEINYVLQVLHEEFKNLEKGISAHEWQKARNSLELSMVASLKDAEGCAEGLGHFETNYGDFALMFRSLERWHDIRQEDVQRVCSQILRPENRTLIAAVPE